MAKNGCFYGFLDKQIGLHSRQLNIEKMISRTKRSICLTILFAVLSNGMFAQNHYDILSTNRSLQWGYGLKATIELNKVFYRPILRLAINAGIGVPFTRFNDGIYPTENIEIAAFNGGIGTNKIRASYFKNWSLTIVSATTLTFQFYKNNFVRGQIPNLVARNSPIYYYENNTFPCLQNPYDVSASIGKNFILQIGDTKPRLQSVGFCNAHIQQFQLSYYNDGGPILEWFGDRKDRYNTGGLTISVNLPRNVEFNNYEISYKKYTGYTKDAFELSNNLNLNFANYRSTEQQFFNRSYWQFSFGDVSAGMRGSIRWNNPDNRYDLQNYIHYDGDFVYHQIPYPAYLSASFDYNYIQTTNRIR